MEKKEYKWVDIFFISAVFASLIFGVFSKCSIIDTIKYNS